MATRSLFVGAGLAFVTLMACSGGGGRETTAEAEGELRHAGQSCGGSQDLKCRSNLKCVPDQPEDDGNGPPPGAVGMPIMPDDDADAGDSNGPPPGAVGMPIFP